MARSVAPRPPHRAAKLAALALAVAVAVVGAGVALWSSGPGAEPAPRTSAPLSAGPADLAARVTPGTYYYSVLQGSDPIGFASSEVLRAGRGLRISDVISARTVVYGDSQSVRGSATSFVSPRLTVDSFALAVGGDQVPFRLVGRPQRPSGVLLPTLAPMALMLAGTPEVGRSGRFWVYNPVAQRVELTTVSISAESALRIVDRARYDSAASDWVPAHATDERAWKITTPGGSLTAWVDRHGRLLTASEPGGLSLVRTAPELASQSAPQAGPPVSTRPNRGSTAVAAGLQ